MAFSITIIVIATLVIAWLGDKLESAARVIGERLSLPDSVRGAVLYAIPSSFPELAVVVIAVLMLDSPHFDVGLGTVVGSAVFNILIIPGCSAVFAWRALRKRGESFAGIRVSGHVLARDGLVYLLVVLLLLFVAIEGALSVLWAGVFLGAYAGYVLWLFIDTKSHRKQLAGGEPEEEAAEEAEEEAVEGELIPNLAILFSAMAAIGVACYFLVEETIHVAEVLGINSYFVAVILTAAATSVPDLVISVLAAQKGGEDAEDAIVNAFSSNIFDVLVCLSVPVLILGQTVVMDAATCRLSVIMLPIVTIVALLLMNSGRRLTVGNGVALLLMYIVFVVGAYYNQSLLTWFGWA